MTILGIIVNLLAILVIDHAYDLKRAERLFENIRNCNENKTSPTMNTEILLCILTKDGQIIDHDSIVPREMHKFIMEITSNKQLAESSQNLYDACSSNDI
ncbi:uncharacterized protein LOC116853095 isoform X2 [Odontomachus brunneus]|uniref:uncharacterized protein LOC116853095 isoform X2 n=1 Tax=Odontomachus brunneus TaxID=486640 RepID=UPI0013F240AF|nr:uncharacterized protein LOC116853095 isoform X2 [Odontomachus brunneus]